MKDCTVKIWEDHKYLGVGVLISKSLVLTCYHVIQPRTSDKLQVSFPLIENSKNQIKVQADVFDERQHITVDLALLHIPDLAELPVSPAVCAVTTDFTEKEFVAYGYPRGVPGGTRAKGTIGKSQEYGWVELTANSHFGHFIKPGFSGGGLYQYNESVIYGIVNAADPEVRAACFIPLNIVFETFKTLKNEISFESAASYLTGAAETDLNATLKTLDDTWLETSAAYRKFRSKTRSLNLKDNEGLIRAELIRLIASEGGSLGDLPANDHYQLLCGLNFKHQDRYFEGLSQRELGFLSFIIRGKKEKHGQIWLLNKLIHKYSRKRSIHEPFILDFSGTNMTFETFLSQLSGYLGFNANGLPEHKVKSKLMVLLTKKIETATQFFIIKNAWTFIHSEGFKRFEDLISSLCDGFTDTGLPHKCIFIFVEEQINKCYEQQGLCVFTEKETSLSGIAKKAAGFCMIDLGTTNPIGDDDLEEWQAVNYSAIRAINNVDPDALTFTDRNPELLIPELCTQIGINYQENEKSWIKY